MGKRVLYIGMEVIGKPKTGGEYGQLRNRSMLEKVCGEVKILEIPKIGVLRHVINLITGKSYGYTPQLMERINQQLNQKYDYIFFDSSCYGYLVRYARNKGFRTFVFFHNVEYEFYKSKFHSDKTVMNFVLIYYIKHQEYLSVKYAGKTIALNERDSKGLNAVYGRNADYVLPIFYKKIEKGVLIRNSIDDGCQYLLFVGADFGSNNDGILWFINNVSPLVKNNIYVAGGCCKAVESKIDITKYPNVKLLGFVDNLDELYINAAGVICPIFSGSGMKTKTIEAMRYGKTVFGTSESFEGIEVKGEQIGGICNTKEEFAFAINSNSGTKFNDYSYERFCDLFSEEAITPKFKKLLEIV